MAERSRVAVLISGRGSNMAALIYAGRADDCPYEVVLVTGDRPEAPGLTLAQAEGTQVARLDAKVLGKAYWDELDATLRAHDIDLVALAGFMRIIPTDFVERWAGRIVNIHPSLLPKYKGLHTQSQALANDDRISGATVHLVTPDLDAGPILLQAAVEVKDTDTVETLSARILEQEHRIYPEAIVLALTDTWRVEGRRVIRRVSAQASRI